MEQRIRTRIEENIALHSRLDGIVPSIQSAADTLCTCIADGGKVMFCGNGGSAADAQHLAAELVNRFLVNRAPMAGLALTTDTSNITSIANDFSYEEIFAKQAEGLGRAGDCLVGISTSGNSANIVRAFDVCAAQGITTIALTGQGGRMAEMADVAICVPSTDTPRIQEVHILIGHMLCEIVEENGLKHRD